MLLKSKVKSKKALMALDMLIGIIISVFALYFVLAQFSETFLQSPQNLNIAKTNAKSIDDFIGFSSNNVYSSFTRCYTTFKISNIENYQFFNKKDNYFYVIDKNAIYIIPLTKLNEFQSKKSTQGLTFDVINFDTKRKKLNLAIDKTNQAAFSFEVLEFFTIGSSSTVVELEQKDDLMIVMIPYIAETTAGQKIGEFVNSKYLQNKYKIMLMDKAGLLIGEFSQTIDTDLAYEVNTGTLFVPKNSISKSIITSELCSFKELNQREGNNYFSFKDKSGNYLNLDKVDYPNRQSTVTYQFNDHYIKFIWKFKPICIEGSSTINEKEFDCSKYIDTSNINYKNFISKSLDMKNTNLEFKDITPSFSILNLKSSDVLENNHVYTFNELFSQPISFTKKELDSRDSTGKLKVGAESYEFVSIKDYIIFGGASKINGVEDDYSNLVFNKDGFLYFFFGIEGDKYIYRHFNSQFLRKDNSKLYLGNFIKDIGDKKNLISEVKCDEGFFNEDSRFTTDGSVCKFNINLQEKSYDFFISKNQMGSVEGVVK